METPARIYIDINSLFELRMARLSYLMNEEELSKLLADDVYNFRDRDIFNVDMKEYGKLDSDIGLLKRSVVTYNLSLIKEKLQGLEKSKPSGKVNKIPEIVINVYPFKLSEKDIEVIQNGIFMKLKEDVFINVISSSLKEISPSFISGGGFLYAFIYEFNEWLNYHLDDIISNKIKMHETLLYFPRLYKADEVEIEKLKGVNDPFEYLMMLLSNSLNIRFLPSVFYSGLPIGIELIENLNSLIIKDSRDNGGEDVDIS